MLVFQQAELPALDDFFEIVDFDYEDASLRIEYPAYCGEKLLGLAKMIESVCEQDNLHRKIISGYVPVCALIEEAVANRDAAIEGHLREGL